MKRKIQLTLFCSLAVLAFLLTALASNALAQTCGNGVVDPGEQCDGGAMSGGCCTAQCTFAPADAACNDGNPNTIDSCNATGACVGRYQTTTCGACRDPNNAQDTSYCDLTTNQCVRQTEDCQPFFVEADGSRNLCQPNYGRDPATGQCLYRAKSRAPTGCLNEACNPSTGEFELVTDDQKAIACGGNNNFCAPLPGGCPQSECRYQSCHPAAEPQNCALSVPINCYATNPSTCQEGVPANAPQGISAGSCQNGVGCIFTATACAPPSNPCEVLVRDGNAVGCCTYRPRDCAAEFGNNPNFTYSCDPTATNSVCIATPKPPPPPQIGPPTTKEQCKNDGWRRFNFPRTFRNQGDCIQFVNTGR